MNKPHFENLKSKEFWKEHFKEISISDILIWIAIALLFAASWQNIQAGRDPCSYCVINDPMQGEVTCKEYFSSPLDVDGVFENRSLEISGDNENTKNNVIRENS